MSITDEISPSKGERERAEKNVSDFLDNMKRYMGDAHMIVGGSIAKDTWLSGSCDVDIFVKFSYEKYRNRDISKILGERIGKEGIKVHGSRDYFQIRRGKFLFEMIPVLDIDDARKAKNITDVSPFHTIWVKKHLKNTDEARLAKQFCRANGLYGAESYIKGFSGYVLEILTAKYGTFFNLAKEAARWKESAVVDAGSHYKSKSEVIKKINKAKLSNLIVVDPVQADRNAAAALSEEKFLRFARLCREFMRNPNDDFFIKKRFSLSDVRREAGNNSFILLKVWPMEGKRDVAGSKMLKSFAYIRKKLIEEGFKVRKSDWMWEGGYGYFWYYAKKEILPENYRHYGPPAKDEKHIEEFRKKWGKVKEKDGRVYVELRREHRKAKDYVQSILGDEYLHENVKRLKLKRLTWIR